MDDSNYKKIKKFIDLVESIQERKFTLQFQKNNLFDIIYSQPNTQKPDEELLRSFILDIRKLYMEKEPTNFKKMFPILMQYTNKNEEVELQEYWNNYEENLKIKIFPVGFLTKKSKTIKDIIDDWFYGHYFHEDEKEKSTLSNLDKSGRDFYKHIFINNLDVLFNTALFLNNLSKKILNRNYSDFESKSN